MSDRSWLPNPKPDPETHEIRASLIPLHAERIAQGLEAAAGERPSAPPKGRSIGWLLQQLDLVEADELRHGDLWEVDQGSLSKAASLAQPTA